MAKSYTVIREIDFDSICHYIAYHSQSDFKHVYTKPQIKYLKNYLTSSEINATTVLFENEYVEKFYLQDFAKYFVTCFADYKRKTSRIHFFSNTFCERTFQMLLASPDRSKKYFGEGEREKILKEIQKSYIGFVVIRPIPRTFIAITCLKPYKSLLKNTVNQTIIKKVNKVNLFGIDLEVESLPYQEQDKVVSACATTALWVSSNAPIYRFESIPSPSEITQESYVAGNTNDRSFPNDGLNLEMMAAYFRHMKLDPVPISLDQEYRTLNPPKVSSILKSMKEIIEAYTSIGLPIILGMDVFEKCADTKEAKFNFIGKHTVTVTAFRKGSNNTVTQDLENEKFVSTSNNIEEICVHDDQIGPYVKINIINDKVQLDTNNGVETDFDEEIDCYLDISIDDFPLKNKRIYLPTLLLIGLPPKVRINFHHIRRTCLSYNYTLREIVKKEPTVTSQFPIDNHGVEWSIKLVKVNAFKRSLLANQDVIGAKDELLSASWPKYIWVASGNNKGQLLFDLLFDATDIEQGNIYLDTIFYSEVYEYFSNNILKKSFSILLEKPVVDNPVYDVDSNFLSIVKSMIKPRENYDSMLDTYYGFPKPPNYYKNKEVEHDAPIQQKGVHIVKTPNDKVSLSLPGPYIWAICREGFLYIGKDIEVGKDPDGKPLYGGHPTLAENLWARIAGELNYCKDKKLWLINNKSGRYTVGHTDINTDKLTHVKLYIEKHAPDECFEIEFKDHI